MDPGHLQPDELGLGTIETAHWEGSESSNQSEGFDAMQFASRQPLVELGSADPRRMLARFDLQHLTRALHAA